MKNLSNFGHLRLAGMRWHKRFEYQKTSISIRGHFAFMQLKKVAQGCRLGNQAEFIPIPLINTNHQNKNSIGPPLYVDIGAST